MAPFRKIGDRAEQAGLADASRTVQVQHGDRGFGGVQCGANDLEFGIATDEHTSRPCGETIAERP
ncbi:hypothetical protein AK37_03158 [Rhodococcus pyridinivorans AK37]|uniref:Uncharacterized protein n=1 Tax=Rhodococcus pyridinivorans AK37 TaxID=1114960 RepID=H0JM13_9NOCA|nr:hypothetical protein AK37_03158 [Rhodococcus pyridinivorans AK37]